MSEQGSVYIPSPSLSMTERPGTAGNPVRDSDEEQGKPRLTIRQLREAAQKENLAKERAKADQKPRDDQPNLFAVPPKKKSSLFGGLFQVREPTQVALNQVAAQMIAQHGSTSATKVPNVRLEKMPEFVPKVNSKWDGIPEHIKQRDKREKEKEKLNAKRESFFSANTKSASDDGKAHRSSRNSSSTTASSFGAYGNSSSSQGASSRTRFYAQSVNSSGDLASQQRTDDSFFPRGLGTQSIAESISESPSRSQRRRSSTGTDPSCASRNEIHLPFSKSPAVERPESTRPRSTKSLGLDVSARPKSSATDRSLGSQTQSTDRSSAWESIDWAQSARSYGIPGVRNASMQSQFPTKVQQVTALSPRPVEPRRPANEPNVQTVSSSETAGKEMPAMGKKKSRKQLNDSDAFLAGEAQKLVLLEDDNQTSLPTTPRRSGQRTTDSGQSRVQQDLEKRPDSSRDRLGLRASMLVTDDMIPWQNQEHAQLPPPTPKIEQLALNTKSMFHKPFGKFGK
ncbi:hypothetical protein H2200_012517 [Cladophialophora chaetospira]|uniref:Uncharacterized protein n=1 Tax=Cladophialophora chaetospira TaxID=386627 RepID=A0AA38WY29_9EURO|nr:hypothetical protein H2200_012517 [Cladophialophora chaetospira]